MYFYPSDLKTDFFIVENIYSNVHYIFYLFCIYSIYFISILINIKSIHWKIDLHTCRNPVTTVFTVVLSAFWFGCLTLSSQKVDSHKNVDFTVKLNTDFILKINFVDKAVFCRYYLVIHRDNLKANLLFSGQTVFIICNYSERERNPWWNQI